MTNEAGDDEGGSTSSRHARAAGTSGRVTPKGTLPRGKGTRISKPRADALTDGGDVTGGAAPNARPTPGHVAAPSRRYTPPVRKETKVSPPWVPILMFALLALGVVVIILNYLDVLPGGADNRWLLAGLVAITGGFVTATQYR